MIGFKIWYEVCDWRIWFSKLPDVSEFSDFWFQTYSLIVRCFEKKSGNSNRPRSLTFSFGFQQTNREAEGARCVVGWIDRWLHEWTDIQVSFKVSCVLDKYMFKSFLFFFMGLNIWCEFGEGVHLFLYSLRFSIILFQTCLWMPVVVPLHTPFGLQREIHKSHTKCDCARVTRSATVRVTRVSPKKRFW